MTNEESLVLDWQACHYIWLPIWLSYGKGSVTNAAFSWRPRYATSRLARLLFRNTEISISREQMRVAKRGAFGLNKNILSIQTKEGKEYRFLVDNVQTWVKVLDCPEETSK